MISSVADTSTFEISKLTPENRDGELTRAANRALEKADFSVKTFLSIKNLSGKDRAPAIEAACVSAGNVFVDLGFLTGCAIVVGDLSSKQFKDVLSSATEKAMKVPRAIDANMTGRMAEFKNDDPGVNFPNWGRAGGRPTPSWADHISRQQLCQIMYDRMRELLRSVGDFKNSAGSVSGEMVKDYFYDYLSLKFLVGVFSGLLFCRKEDFDKIVISAPNGTTVVVGDVLAKVGSALGKYKVDELIAQAVSSKFPGK